MVNSLVNISVFSINQCEAGQLTSGVSEDTIIIIKLPVEFLLDFLMKTRFSK